MIVCKVLHLCSTLKAWRPEILHTNKLYDKVSHKQAYYDRETHQLNDHMLIRLCQRLTTETVIILFS